MAKQVLQSPDGVAASEFSAPDVESARRLITSAELLASTTPVVIVPAEAGTIFVLVRAEAYLHAGATPYTYPDGIHVVQTTASYGVAFGPDFLTAAADAFVDAGSAAPALFSDVSLFINQPIVLLGSDNPTLGDGTLDVFVQFTRLVP